MTKTTDTTENYYTILKCDESASYTQIKHSYQNLIKHHHPDKQTDVKASGDTFLKIDRAWKVLRDEQLRKEYDACLLQNKIAVDSLIYAELSKNDVTFNDESVAYYPCRCGDNFEILKEYLKEIECTIECSQCSNCIVIK